MKPTLLIATLSVFALSTLFAFSPVHQPRQRRGPLAYDTLPSPQLPAGANPDDPDWKGIDLEPKTPVQPLTPAEEASRFLLPPGNFEVPNELAKGFDVPWAAPLN